MNNPERRLEQGLRAWEDHCFCMRLMVQMYQQTGQPSLYGQLPPELMRFERLRPLMLRALNLPEDDKNPFTEASEPEYVDPTEGQSFRVVREFPFALLDWASHSRRIFTLSQDLQLLLQETSLDGVVCTELHPPFDTYAIALPQPIRDTSGNAYDALTFTYGKNEEAAMLHINLLGSELSSYRALTRAEKRGYEEIVRRKRSKEYSVIEGLLRRRGPLPITNYTVLLRPKPASKPAKIIAYRELRSRMQTDDDRWSIQVLGEGPQRNVYEYGFHIAIGLALYLETIQAGSTEQAWKPLPTTVQNVACVTDGAMVCDIQLHGRLETSERAALEALQEPRKTVIPHFRRGTWRRPPGQGHDPNARRTVWQKPAIVHRDMLPKDALPLAQETKVDKA